MIVGASKSEICRLEIQETGCVAVLSPMLAGQKSRLETQSYYVAIIF